MKIPLACALLLQLLLLAPAPAQAGNGLDCPDVKKYKDKAACDQCTLPAPDFTCGRGHQLAGRLGPNNPWQDVTATCQNGQVSARLAGIDSPVLPMIYFRCYTTACPDVKQFYNELDCERGQYCVRPAPDFTCDSAYQLQALLSVKAYWMDVIATCPVEKQVEAREVGQGTQSLHFKTYRCKRRCPDVTRYYDERACEKDNYCEQPTPDFTCRLGLQLAGRVGTTADWKDMAKVQCRNGDIEAMPAGSASAMRMINFRCYTRKCTIGWKADPSDSFENIGYCPKGSCTQLAHPELTCPAGTIMEAHLATGGKWPENRRRKYAVWRVAAAGCNKTGHPIFFDASGKQLQGNFTKAYCREDPKCVIDLYYEGDTGVYFDAKYTKPALDSRNKVACPEGFSILLNQSTLNKGEELMCDSNEAIKLVENGKMTSIIPQKIGCIHKYKCTLNLSTLDVCTRSSCTKIIIDRLFKSTLGCPTGYDLQAQISNQEWISAPKVYCRKDKLSLRERHEENVPFTKFRCTRFAGCKASAYFKKSHCEKESKCGEMTSNFTCAAFHTLQFESAAGWRDVASARCTPQRLLLTLPDGTESEERPTKLRCLLHERCDPSTYQQNGCSIGAGSLKANAQCTVFTKEGCPTDMGLQTVDTNWNVWDNQPAPPTCNPATRKLIISNGGYNPLYMRCVKLNLATLYKPADCKPNEKCAEPTGYASLKCPTPAFSLQAMFEGKQDFVTAPKIECAWDKCKVNDVEVELQGIRCMSMNTIKTCSTCDDVFEMVRQGGVCPAPKNPLAAAMLAKLPFPKCRLPKVFPQAAATDASGVVGPETRPPRTTETHMAHLRESLAAVEKKLAAKVARLSPEHQKIFHEIFTKPVMTKADQNLRLSEYVKAPVAVKALLPRAWKIVFIPDLKHD